MIFVTVYNKFSQSEREKQMFSCHGKENLRLVEENSEIRMMNGINEKLSVLYNVLF